ncbi:MAG: patatin-like phospholipase family protein [Candidatus Eisenbacteria bacterium]
MARRTDRLSSRRADFSGEITAWKRQPWRGPRSRAVPARPPVRIRRRGVRSEGPRAWSFAAAVSCLVVDRGSPHRCPPRRRRAQPAPPPSRLRWAGAERAASPTSALCRCWSRRRSRSTWWWAPRWAAWSARSPIKDTCSTRSGTRSRPNPPDLFDKNALSLFYGGFVKGDRLESFLDRHLAHKKIESMAVRYAAVAVELKTGRIRVFDSGSVARAVHASCAIPGVFVPVEIDSTTYVDGGVVDPVPADVAREPAPRW